jgi:hypothetical protein
LKVGFGQTDILGALLLAEHLFHERLTDQRVLIVFSDMRQDTMALDLESPDRLDTKTILGKTDRKRLMAELGKVEVYILAARGASLGT